MPQNRQKKSIDSKLHTIISSKDASTEVIGRQKMSNWGLVGYMPVKLPDVTNKVRWRVCDRLDHPKSGLISFEPIT